MFAPTQNKLTLIEAIKNGDSKLAFALIEQGANLNLQDQCGYTALMWAIEFDLTDIALALIEKGADLNLKSNVSSSALWVAAWNGRTKIVLALLKQGADPNYRNPSKSTALICAAQNGYTETTLALIENGADFNLQNKYGNTVLIEAVSNSRTDIVLALIENGANLNLQNKNGKTALMLASAPSLRQFLQKATELEEIKSLSEAGFFILACLQNKTISDKEASALIKRTARRLAPQRENKVETEIHPEQIARELITLDWTQNAQEVIQKIPALSQDQRALYAQHLRTLSANTFQSAAPDLLSINFELDQSRAKEKNTFQSKLANLIKKPDSDLIYALKTINTLQLDQEQGQTIFFVLLSCIERAASTQIGNQSLLSQLLDNPSFRMELMAFFITYYASQNNEVAIFKRPSDSLKVCFDTLVQNHPQAPEWMKGALPENTNASAQASSALPAAAANYPFRLIEAIKKGDSELAFALIEQGADLNLQDKEGNTALVWAILYNRTDLALALIEKGADLNLQDKDGNTALMQAAWNSRTNLALALIEKGADLNLQDNRCGYTALMWAIIFDHTDIALALIEKGADFNLQNKNGTTVLMRAIVKGLREITLALIEKGADLNDGNTALSLAPTSSLRTLLQKAVELEKIDSLSEAGLFLLSWLEAKSLSDKEASALIKRTARRLAPQRENKVETEIHPEQTAHELITLDWTQNVQGVIQKISTLSQDQRALYAQHLRTLSADTFQSAAPDLLSISFELDQSRAKEKSTIRFQLATLIKKPDSDLAYALKTINTIAFTQEQRESLFVALLSCIERAASTQIGNQSLLSQLLANPSFRTELMTFFISFYAGQNNKVDIFKNPPDSLKTCFDTLVQNYHQAPEWMKGAPPENTHASEQDSSVLPAAPKRFMLAFPTRKAPQSAPGPAHLGRVGLNNKGLQADDGTFKL